MPWLTRQIFWEVDPFEWPRCGAEMKLVALIDDNQVIEKILRHLGLRSRQALPVRAPPDPIMQDYVHEPFFDDPTCKLLPSRARQGG